MDNEVIVQDKEILESIIDKIEYEPIDNRVLVKPLPEVMLEKEVTMFDDEANEGKDLTKEEAVMKTEVREVEANYRKGIVLKVGKGQVDTPFGVGDIVVYSKNAGVDFELFKDSRLLQRYEIVAKIQQ